MGKIKLLEYNKQQILGLEPSEIKQFLLVDEIIHIFKATGSYWEYNYRALQNGRLGLHAETKGGEHTDKFFYSEILSSHKNILEIFADQLALSFNQLGTFRPDWVAGIPNGASKIGKLVADKLETKNIELVKDDSGQIKFPIGQIMVANERGLLVDDFFTKGTAAVEAVAACGDAPLLRIVMYIISRGWRESISTARGEFSVKSLGRQRVTVWPSGKCPLCAKGVGVIKPKTPENWQKLITSQA